MEKNSKFICVRFTYRVRRFAKEKLFLFFFFYGKKRTSFFLPKGFITLLKL